MSSSERLRVEGIEVQWAGTPVLAGIDLALGAGEFFTLLGPNGSGKTTLLRVIAGFERPGRGRVWLDGRDVTDLPVYRRGIGYLAQEPVLLAGRTLWENVAYGPYLHHWPDREVDDRVQGLLHRLHLGALADRRPAQLSGGERQRAALARALAPRPAVLLLDEPFAAVDPEIKGELRAEFRRVLAEERPTVVHVTHDREEGLFLGDRVGLLLAGRLERVGPPREVYADPGSVPAARFLGYNVVDGPQGPLAVHPSDLRLVPPGTGRFDATVTARGPVGRDEAVHLLTAGGERVEVRGAAVGGAAVGEATGVTWVHSARLGAGAPSGAPGRDRGR